MKKYAIYGVILLLAIGAVNYCDRRKLNELDEAFIMLKADNRLLLTSIEKKNVEITKLDTEISRLVKKADEEKAKTAETEKELASIRLDRDKIAARIAGLTPNDVVSGLRAALKDSRVELLPLGIVFHTDTARINLTKLQEGANDRRELDKAYGVIGGLKAEVGDVRGALIKSGEEIGLLKGQVIDYQNVAANLEKQVGIAVSAGGVKYRKGFIAGALVGAVVVAGFVLLAK